MALFPMQDMCSPCSIRDGRTFSQMRLGLEVNDTLALCFHARPLEPPFHTVAELLATGGAIGNEARIICVPQDVGGLRTPGKLVAQLLLVIDRISKRPLLLITVLKIITDRGSP